MISTDSLQVGFLSSLNIVNERFKNDHFLKNEIFEKTIVFSKNENVNIPNCMLDLQLCSKDKGRK